MSRYVLTGRYAISTTYLRYIPGSCERGREMERDYTFGDLFARNVVPRETKRWVMHVDSS